MPIKMWDYVVSLFKWIGNANDFVFEKLFSYLTFLTSVQIVILSVLINLVVLFFVFKFGTKPLKLLIAVLSIIFFISFFVSLI